MELEIDTHSFQQLAWRVGFTLSALPWAEGKEDEKEDEGLLRILLVSSSGSLIARPCYQSPVASGLVLPSVLVPTSCLFASISSSAFLRNQTIDGAAARALGLLSADVANDVLRDQLLWTQALLEDFGEGWWDVYVKPLIDEPLERMQSSHCLRRSNI